MGFKYFFGLTSHLGYLVAIGLFVGGFLSLCLLLSAGGYFFLIFFWLLNQEGIGFRFVACSK